MARSTDSWDESDVRIRPNKKGTRPRTKDRPSYDDAVTGRIITVDRGRYTAVVAADPVAIEPFQVGPTSQNSSSIHVGSPDPFHCTKC